MTLPDLPTNIQAGDSGELSWADAVSAFYNAYKYPDGTRLYHPADFEPSGGMNNIDGGTPASSGSGGADGGTP